MIEPDRGPHELAKAMGLGAVQVDTWMVVDTVVTHESGVVDDQTRTHLVIEGFEYLRDADGRIMVNQVSDTAVTQPVRILIDCRVTRWKDPG
jgi:hypothetical protein